MIEPYLFIFGVFATLFGACVGSFLNVCIYRIPRDESVVTPRSHCPGCKKLIPWYLNIPVLSWIVLRGKCAECRCSISFRYTLVELITALFFLTVYLQWAIPGWLGLPLLATPGLILCYWIFLAGLILGTFVDFEHFIIPDSVTIGGMVAGLILSAVFPAMHGCEIWWRGLAKAGLGMAAGFGSLYAIATLGTFVFKKEAMGFGDVKLMGAIGSFLGWQAVLFTIFASSLFGSLFGVIMIMAGAAKMQSRIPFGPYISLGAIVWLFWGSNLLSWYLQLMGR